MLLVDFQLLCKGQVDSHPINKLKCFQVKNNLSINLRIGFLTLFKKTIDFIIIF
jgi:hypothetical protein